jgi:hypothetical protein
MPLRQADDEGVAIPPDGIAIHDDQVADGGDAERVP